MGLSDVQKKWLAWGGLGVALAIFIVVGALVLLDHNEQILKLAGITGVHGQSVIFAVVLGCGGLAITATAGIVLGVQEPRTDQSPPRSWRAFRNLLVTVLGVLCGWAVAVVFTPFGDQDAARLHLISQTLTVFASGYLVSKLDRFLERSLFDGQGVPTAQWVLVALFSGAFFCSLLMTFEARQYSTDSISTPVVFTASPAVTLEAGDSALAIDKDNRISVDGRAYGSVAPGAQVKFAVGSGLLYIDGDLRESSQAKPEARSASTPGASPASGSAGTSSQVGH